VEFAQTFLGRLQKEERRKTEGGEYTQSSREIAIGCPIIIETRRKRGGHLPS